MTRPACLLVTCCLEQSRSEILSEVIKNLHEQASELRQTLTVFDNASTVPGVHEMLKASFDNVFTSDMNVGYWSAIDWWLAQLPIDTEYTYVIESDMLHYAWNKVQDCCYYLDQNPEVGAVRLHEYSVMERHLYDKDVPISASRRQNWQSHTNHVTGARIHLFPDERSRGDMWRSNFLTQLPALNRYPSMRRSFLELEKLPQFTELDFQRLYHADHPVISVLDGGIFDGGHFAWDPKYKPVTSSWMTPEQFAVTGYQSTRFAKIVPRDQYSVSRV